MKTLNIIRNSGFLIAIAFLYIPKFSIAMPHELACKLYGERGSAQMRSAVVNGKTFLVFSAPVAWGNVNRFEVVFSSGYNKSQPLYLGANGIDTAGRIQTVQIALNPPSTQLSVRYGKVIAGDYRSNWYSTTGKFKEYEIQCFNF